MLSTLLLDFLCARKAGDQINVDAPHGADFVAVDSPF